MKHFISLVLAGVMTAVSVTFSSHTVTAETEHLDNVLMTDTKENIMGTLPIGKLLMKMSVPVILSMFVSTLYGVIDSIFSDYVLSVRQHKFQVDLMIGIVFNKHAEISALPRLFSVWKV